MQPVRFLLFIIFCFFIGLEGFAGTTGKIRGLVLEKDTGEPLIGANIQIQGTALGSSTDVNGYFFIINVPPGNYNMEATMIGYAKVIVSNVQVFTDRTTTQSFTLSEEIIEGTEVVVTATRPIIEKDRTNSTAYINSEQIDALPVQEVEDLIQLQTGITKDAAGRFHMRGGRAGEIAYLVDGIPVTDQFSGGSSIEIENSWVQELQVISGTFNAEYGQAQSGVINVITKGGRKKYSGKISLWAGDYVSTNDDVFMNINDIGLGETNGQLSLGGPLNFLPKGSFFINSRVYDREGWLYGQRRTRIEDTTPIQSYYHDAQQSPTDEERLVGIKIPDSLQTGDRAFVPLNPLTKYNTYANISFEPARAMNLEYSIFADYQSRQSYSDARRYAPDGVPTSTSTGFNHIINFTHTLSQRVFYKLGFSYASKLEESMLFDDPLDSSYQGSELNLNGFLFGGTNDSRSRRELATALAKFDLTSQIGQYNLVKIGLEAKRHDLNVSSLTTISRGPVYEQPQLEIPAQNTSGNNTYTQQPIEFAAFIQDKVEFDEIILNAGIRFDYWHSLGDVLVDPEAVTQTGNGIRIGSALRGSDPQYQLSPRVGMAFPISEKGVMHVSYGHFFQIPRFSYIFTNSEFEIELGDLETIVGNANLKPEKNIAYEIGIQQEVAPGWGLQATVYYKDIKNLLGQEIINTRDKKIYARYINRDYGNVKGITLSLEKVYSNQVAGTIDYTYQIARGNASDPNSVFSDFQSRPPRESEKQVLPLDWDQQNTLNTTIRIGDPKNWNIGVIGRFKTGQPYSPSNPGSALTTQFENSARKPVIYDIDLNMHKSLHLLGQKVRAFLRVYNLLDRLNENRVYTSTGNASQPFRPNSERSILSRNPNFSIAEIDLRPDFLFRTPPNNHRIQH